MSQEQLDALVARLNSDPDFARALGAASSADDALGIAAANGFGVTAGELAGVEWEHDLSDLELEQVAGGTYPTAVSHPCQPC